MKKFINVLYIILTVLCISFAFSGCFDDNKKMSVSDENIKYEYTEMLGWQVKVTGYIENTTGKDLSYISVEYKVYDSSNAVIGTALANANNISAGEKWRFEAMSFTFFNEKPAKVTFSEIQSMKDF